MLKLKSTKYLINRYGGGGGRRGGGGVWRWEVWVYGCMFERARTEYPHAPPPPHAEFATEEILTLGRLV